MKPLDLLLLISMYMSTKVMAGELPIPPVSQEFRPQQVGSVHTLDVKVVEQSSYAVTVQFHFKKPKYSFWSPQKQSPEDAARLSAMLGGSEQSKDGNWFERGIPAKFRVQIERAPDGTVIVDKKISNPETLPAYMGRYAALTTNVLPVGAYKIRIDYLEGAPELAPLYAEFTVAKSHHGK